MAGERWSLARDLGALVIAAVACPVALFGGSLLGCVGQGFNAECAMRAVFISPVVLLAGGVAAGIVTRGWTGLLVTGVGVLIGMVSILLLSFGVSEPVPLDPISGVIATFWFGVPVAIGYGIARAGVRLFGLDDGG